MFTAEERAIIELHRNPESSDMRRATRLGVQYLIGAGIFTLLAVAYNSWFAVFIFLEFVAYVALRLLGARRVAGVMPGILAKYEARIAGGGTSVDHP